MNRLKVVMLLLVANDGRFSDVCECMEEPVCET